MPRALLNELKRAASIVVSPLASAVHVAMTDGRVVNRTDQCFVDLRLRTAAGPFNVRGVRCFELDSEDDEFLLGNENLKLMGIDVGHLVEQLAGETVDGDEGYDTLVDDAGGKDNDDEISGCFARMLRDAKEDGFDSSLLHELRAMIKRHRDVWRVRLGLDEPA